MSDMLKRYEESKKPRPEQAHQIPGLATNVIDVTNKFQEGFVTQQKHGDETKFTSVAQQYFDEEYKNIVLTESFQPTDQGIKLHRYTPAIRYYNPGQPNS